MTKSLARNEVVLDNLDAMDSDLCIVDDEEDEESTDEESGVANDE